MKDGLQRMPLHIEPRRRYVGYVIESRLEETVWFEWEIKDAHQARTLARGNAPTAREAEERMLVELDAIEPCKPAQAPTSPSPPENVNNVEHPSTNRSRTERTEDRTP